MEILNGLHGFLWSSQTENNSNTFLIDGEKKILVDPGHHQLFGHVQDGLSRLSLTPQDIDLVIITHAHPDHMEAVKIFSDTATLIAVSAVEMDFIKSFPPHLLSTFGVADFEPEVLLQEGELKVGNVGLQVIHTPGHSPGSVCIYWPDQKVLFAGDLVFNQGVGRTDIPGGDGQKLKESINMISSLDVDYLLTGHGEIVNGREFVKTNFRDIKRLWFAYI